MGVQTTAVSVLNKQVVLNDAKAEGGYLPNYLFALCFSKKFNESSYRQFIENPEVFLNQNEPLQGAYQAICDKWERKEVVRPACFSDRVWEVLPVRAETIVEKAERAMGAGLDRAKPFAQQAKESATSLAKNASRALPSAKKLAAVAAIALIAGSGIQTYNKRIEDQLQTQALERQTYLDRIDEFCTGDLPTHQLWAPCTPSEIAYFKSPERIAQFAPSILTELPALTHVVSAQTLMSLRKRVTKCDKKDIDCMDNCLKPPKPEIPPSHWELTAQAVSEAWESSTYAAKSAIKTHSLAIATAGVSLATAGMGYGFFRIGEKVVKCFENPKVQQFLQVAAPSAIILGSAKTLFDHREAVLKAGQAFLTGLNRWREKPVMATVEMAVEAAEWVSVPVAEEFQTPVTEQPVQQPDSWNRYTTLLATAVVVSSVYKIGYSIWNRFLKED